jgi:hypothetical protein
MGGKSGGDTTTVQKADPWVEQQPYLKDIYSQAQGWYNTPGPHFFPEATNVPFSNQSELGLQMMQDRAQYGSPVNQTAQNQLSQTNAGGFLNSNPWLDRTYEMGARAVMPGINATFGGANRTGSNAHTTALGQGLGDLATGIYGGNYQQERGRQLQAASLSPALAGTDYQDMSKKGLNNCKTVLVGLTGIRIYLHKRCEITAQLFKGRGTQAALHKLTHKGLEAIHLLELLAAG